jgi:hypothetical protein
MGSCKGGKWPCAKIKRRCSPAVFVASSLHRANTTSPFIRQFGASKLVQPKSISFRAHRWILVAHTGDAVHTAIMRRHRANFKMLSHLRSQGTVDLARRRIFLPTEDIRSRYRGTRLLTASHTRGSPGEKPSACRHALLSASHLRRSMRFDIGKAAKSLSRSENSNVVAKSVAFG